MTFRQSIGQGSQALDINQKIGQLAGYGTVEGGEPSIGARPFAIDFLSARTYLEGEEIDLDATSVDLEDYAVADKPRKAVIYIGRSEFDEGGEYKVAAGDPADPKPEGAVRFDTFEPSPPDLSGVPSVPMVEVWLGANAQQLIDDDYRDRRLESKLSPRTITARQASFSTSLIDGAGVEHNGGLGPADVNPSDAEIIEAINTDSDHGSTAPHYYFSGAHSDLTDIASDDHHTRRTDVEDRAAVRGALDAADLAATSAETPGMHLGVPDGVDAVWVAPPKAEAPVIDEGTLTHTGGSTTVVRLEGVTPSKISATDLSVGMNVDSPPSWSGDYAYSTEVATYWDDAAAATDIELTITWATDPGSGNDLSLAYSIWQMDPDVVSDLYDDQDAAEALQGTTIDPGTMDLATRLQIPVYDELPGDAASTTGDTLIATGNGTAEWGAYQYDGAAWSGPYTSGLTALSELEIDVAKDWNGEPITNLGAPTQLGSLLRLGTITDHAANDSAHHAPTTSSDIDHSLISNVQPDQHHPAPTGEHIGMRASGKFFDVSTTTALIPNNDDSRIHAVIGSDETAQVIRGELIDEEGTNPSGLQLEIADLETQSVIYEQTAQTATGSVSNPLVSIEGPQTIDIGVTNETGTAIAASGGVVYRLDQGTVYGSLISMLADNGSRDVRNRQGVRIEANTRLAGFNARLSANTAGATTAYIQESGGGAVLAQEDISTLSAGDYIELRSSRPIDVGEAVYVSADNGGDQYTRGHGEEAGQFPYSSSDFDVTGGVYSEGGSLSSERRYIYDEVQAIRLE